MGSEVLRSPLNSGTVHSLGLFQIRIHFLSFLVYVLLQVLTMASLIASK